MPRHAVRGRKGRFVARADRRGTFFDTLTPGIGLYRDSILVDARRIAREWAKDAVDYMQANAPWEDRSGDARAGLDFSIDEGLTDVTVTLFHSVSYGKWLEIRWNGKFAIILPTIEALGPDLMQRLEGVF